MTDSTTPTRTPPPIHERGYANADMLVSTEWVEEHLDDPDVRIIESDEDLLLYSMGHIPGAVRVDWINDLNDAVARDYIDQDRLQELLREKGINEGMTLVFYGDKNNWWACYALWVLELFGVPNMKIMDGGRALWKEEGRPMTDEVPSYPRGNIVVGDRNEDPIRAFREDVLAQVNARGKLVDVRSPEEFSGERLHMPDYPNEGAVRGGHIPGARNVPWARAVDPETHTFLDADTLRRIYEEEQKLNPSDPIIAYCRIGERSSHTWFVLTYLLGFESVRNYDGSWTEWGNLVRAPIER